jgi:hypothetical protein
VSGSASAIETGSESQIGIKHRFPSLSPPEREAMAMRIDAASTITACSFCNATTSRNKNDKTVEEILAEVTGTPDEILEHVVRQLKVLPEKKRADVGWKLRCRRNGSKSFNSGRHPRKRTPTTGPLGQDLLRPVRDRFDVQIIVCIHPPAA